MAKLGGIMGRGLRKSAPIVKNLAVNAAIVAAATVSLLSAAPACAAAVDSITITSQFNGDGTETLTFNFTTGLSPSQEYLTDIYIPEFHAGDLSITGDNFAAIFTHSLGFSEIAASAINYTAFTYTNAYLPYPASTLADFFDIHFGANDNLGSTGPDQFSLVFNVPSQNGVTANADVHFQYAGGDIISNTFQITDGVVSNTVQQQTPSVPEPGTLALLATGLVGLVKARRRKG